MWVTMLFHPHLHLWCDITIKFYNDIVSIMIWWAQANEKDRPTHSRPTARRWSVKRCNEETNGGSDVHWR